jgi:hypothetical protein
MEEHDGYGNGENGNGENGNGEYNITPLEYLQSQYDQLKTTFNYVCNKYNIKQCHTCKKYRKNTNRCPCGAIHCRKCVNLEVITTVTFVRCYLCDIITCSNCSTSSCSECDKFICNHCVVYNCSNYYLSNCQNILCRNCSEVKCKVCLQLICKYCRVGHHPCYPILCSCDSLVYPINVSRVNIANTYGVVSTDGVVSIDCVVNRVGDYEYPIIICTVCRKTSCGQCVTQGHRHRAYHSIIPFIIANNRGDLPCYIPSEVVVMIWEYMLR